MACVTGMRPLDHGRPQQRIEQHQAPPPRPGHGRPEAAAGHGLQAHHVTAAGDVAGRLGEGGAVDHGRILPGAPEPAVKPC
jgi:hypothetical protein